MFLAQWYEVLSMNRSVKSCTEMFLWNSPLALWQTRHHTNTLEGWFTNNLPTSTSVFISACQSVFLCRPHIWNALIACFLHLFILSLNHLSAAPRLRRDKGGRVCDKRAGNYVNSWLYITELSLRVSSKQPVYILRGGKGTVPLEPDDAILLSVMCHALPVKSPSLLLRH